MTSADQFGEWTSRPQADIAPEVQPFWDGLSEGRFLMCRCSLCGRHYWPYTVCPQHEIIPEFEQMEWTAASGLGEVFTFVVVYKVVDLAYAEEVPYALAMVKLDEGPLFPSRITSCAVGDVHIGMRLSVDIVHDANSGNYWPMFAAVGSG